MTDEEKREHRRAYSKQYYQEHKDACLEKQRRWRQNHPEEYKEQTKNQNKKYKESHKEEIRKKQKEYREKNKERLSQYRVRYYENHIAKTQTLDYKAYHRAYYQKNRSELDAHAKKRNIENNKESKKYAVMHHIRWTPEEEEILKEMLSQGETRKEIAYTLRRTISSINGRIRKIRKEANN